MSKFPKDASRARVIAALEAFGFQIIRERLTLPNHKTIKSLSLRIICRQSAVTRDDLLKAYEES